MGDEEFAIGTKGHSLFNSDKVCQGHRHMSRTKAYGLLDLIMSRLPL